MARSAPQYTNDQLKHVKRIKKCKDHYEILGLTEDATNADIRKAYKKLALQLHPDKNKAPGAADAFKIVRNAVEVLMDTEKRKIYDQCSQSEQMRSSHSRQTHAHSYYCDRAFEAEITAEELLTAFFGGGFAQYEFNVNRGTRWTRQTQNQQRPNGFTAFIWKLPVLILLIVFTMSNFSISHPAAPEMTSVELPELINLINSKFAVVGQNNSITRCLLSLLCFVRTIPNPGPSVMRGWRIFICYCFVNGIRGFVIDACQRFVP